MTRRRGGIWQIVTLPSRWWNAAQPPYAKRLQALEYTLNDMADRVAQAELQAAREIAYAKRCEARADALETLMIRLQDNLDHARGAGTT
jgi:hypothetical protein